MTTALAWTIATLVAAADSAAMADKLDGAWEPECLVEESRLAIDGDTLARYAYYDALGHEATLFAAGRNLLIIPTGAPDPVRLDHICFKTQHNEDVAVDWDRTLTDISSVTAADGAQQLQFTVNLWLTADNHRFSIAHVYYEYNVLPTPIGLEINLNSARPVRDDISALASEYRILSVDNQGNPDVAGAPALQPAIKHMLPVIMPFPAPFPAPVQATK